MDKKNHPLKIILEEGKNYFFCTCKKSSTMPFCDGTHKGSNFTPQKIKGDGKVYPICSCHCSKTFPRCDGTHRELEVKSESCCKTLES